ncbi:MAG: VWA domain-containing protein [Acidobacteriota bacterium]
MSSRALRNLVFAVLCLVLGWPLAAQPADLILVLDASGSMWGQIDGKNKIVIAREVFAELVDDLPDEQTVGVVAYGHRREGDCEDIELVAPLARLDRAQLKTTVDGLQPKGKTPLTAAVERAFEEVRQRDSATVILISDGLETCNADPCAAVRRAKDEGLDFILHVVGFDVSKEDLSSLECAAQAGDGLFFSAANANELGTALEQAVQAPVDEPPGALAVKVINGGELQDASVVVTTPSGEQVNLGRTYTDPSTNPRRLPLAAGSYEVKVQALGIKGDTQRRFSLTLEEGEVAEREFDFTSGGLSIGVLRNGQLSDATVRVYLAGTSQEVASGRTYTSEKTNPKAFELTPGTYDVQIQSVEIKGPVRHTSTDLVVNPGDQTTAEVAFESGEIALGARRDGALADAVVHVRSVATGKAIAQGRTYTSEKTNPKVFTVEPGEYRVSLKPAGDGEPQEHTVTVETGGRVEKMVDF